MTHSRPAFCAAIGLALSALLPLAHAEFTGFSLYYFYPNDFVSGLRNPAVDTFDDFVSGSLPAQLARQAGNYSYVVSSSDLLYSLPQSYGSPLDPVLSLSTTEPADPLIFSQFSGNVSAIGMFIFATNADGSLASDNPLSVKVTDSKGATFGFETQPYGSGPGAFFGLTSDANIVSFTVSVLPGHSDVYASVDGLVLGAAPVPEPSTAALLLAGLSLAALPGIQARRRRGTFIDTCRTRAQA